MRRLWAMLCGIVVFFLWQTVLYGADDQGIIRVSVLPLQGSQDSQYNYLTSGVRQMLISRLVNQGGFEIVDSAVLTERPTWLRRQLKSGSFDEVQKEIDTDLVVDGTFYSLKDAVQLNISVYSLTTEIRQKDYSLKAESPENLMGAISSLAAQIGEDVSKIRSISVELADKSSDQGAIDSFETPHPEREYKKGLFAGATLFGDGKDEGFQSKGVRKSSSIPYTIETMALGDLNGDGVTDLVVASRSKIRVFKFTDRRFREVAGFNLDPNNKIHVMNIDDPGGTGMMKLFVSANRGKAPSSMIFSWDGSEKLQLLQDTIRYYIRPVWWPGKGVILAGQKDSPNISDDFLEPGVYELTGALSGDGLTKGPKLLLPKGTNLFDFIVADLNGDREVETMVIDAQQKLLVYDSGLNLSWVSSANYGGSKTFFGPPISGADKLDPLAEEENLASEKRLVYIPGRLDLKDITGDGLPEVVVSTNDVGLDKWLENVRTYDGGAVACLTWRGAGLMELWRTNHIEGYVADYAFDGDGEITDKGERLLRLYVAQIPDSTLWDLVLPGKDDSKILAYEMTVKREQPAQ